MSTTLIKLPYNSEVESFLKQEQDIINSRDYNLQVAWLRSLGNILSADDNAGDFLYWRKCKVLYTVRHAWEHLLRDAEGHWKYDFYIWARAYMKTRARVPAQQTIRNMVATYNTFVGCGEIELPTRVMLPKRTEDGDIIKNGEGAGFYRVDFSIDQIDYSKLLVSKSLANELKMLPDELWTLICDPFVSVNRVLIQIEKIRRSQAVSEPGENGQSEGTQDKPPFRYYQQEGIFYAARNGRTIPVFALVYEEANDPLFIEAVGDLCAILQQPMPEFLLEGVPR